MSGCVGMRYDCINTSNTCPRPWLGSLFPMGHVPMRLSRAGEREDSPQDLKITETKRKSRNKD